MGTDRQSDRYRGPRYFEDTPEDHRVFFGRSAEIEAIAQQVLASRLLVLFGKSGLGKTSLLLAGLFPRLRAEELLPLRIRLATSDSPLELVIQTAEATSLEFGVDCVPGDRDSLWEFFKTAMFWRGGTLLTPVLVFDQFEEIFTLGTPDSRTAFAREIGPLVSGNPPETVRGRLRETPPNVKIILSFREEFLAALQELSAHIPGLFQERSRLQPFSEAQARDAIQKPAAVESVTAEEKETAAFSTPPFLYDKEALDEMLAFLKGRSDTVEPFQLQLLCQHIEQTIVKPVAQAKSGLSETDPIRVKPADLGGRSAMTAVLQRFYTDSLAALPRAQRKRAQELCESGLLTGGGHRLMLQEDQIRHEYKLSEKTLEYLVDKRILRKEPRLESLFYELSHDTLAQSILRVRRWRIPKKWRPALALGGAATAIILVLIGVSIWRLDAERRSLDQARENAENLVAFLIGDDLMERIRPMGRLEIMDQVQHAVDRYLPSLQEKNVSDLARRNRGLALLNEGDVLRQKGRVRNAKEKYTQARAVFTELRGRDSRNPNWRHDYANATDRLADIATDQLQLSEGLEFSRESLRIRAQLLSEKEKALVPERLLREEADNYLEIGLIYQKQRRLTDALQQFEKALSLARAPSGPASETIESLYVCHDGNIDRGEVLMAQGRRKESREALERALDCAKRAKEKSPFEPAAHYRIGLAINKLANLQTEERPREVLLQYQKLYEVIKDVAKWDSSNAKWKREAAATVILLGEGHAYRGDYDGALKLYDEGFQALQKLHRIDEGNDSLAADIAWVHVDMIDALRASNRPPEADAHIDDAMSLVERLVKIDATNADMQDTLLGLQIRKANALRDRGEIDPALERYAKASALVSSAKPIDSSDTWHRNLVNWLNQELELVFDKKAESEIEAGKKLEARHPENALEAYRQAVAFEEKSVSLQSSIVGRQWSTGGPARTGSAYQAMGKILQRRGQPLQAIASFRRAEQEFRKAPDLVAALRVRSQDIEPLCEGQAGRTEMREACHEAVDPGKDTNPEALGKARQQLGDEFEKAGEPQRASASYALAEQEFRRAIAQKPENLALWNELGSLFFWHVAPLRTGQRDSAGAVRAYREALAAFVKTTELDPKSAAHHSDVSYVHQHVGASLEEQGNHAEAINEFRQAIADAQLAIELDPKTAWLHDTLATAEQLLGDGLLSDNQLPEALATYAVAEQEFREGLKLEENLAIRWYNLSQLLQNHIAPVRKKRADEAGELLAYKDALAAIERAVALASYEPDYRKVRDGLQTILQGRTSR